MSDDVLGTATGGSPYPARRPRRPCTEPGCESLAQARRKTCARHRPTHPRSRKATVRRASQVVGAVYAVLTPEEWQHIWRMQDGRCRICTHRLWNRYGEAARTNDERAANLDHDHAAEKALLAAGHSREDAIRRSVRGLLCGYPCNRLLVRHWTPANLARAAAYTRDAPAQKWLTHGTPS